MGACVFVVGNSVSEKRVQKKGVVIGFLQFCSSSLIVMLSVVGVGVVFNFALLCGLPAFVVYSYIKQENFYSWIKPKRISECLS